MSIVAGVAVISTAIAAPVAIECCDQARAECPGCGKPVCPEHSDGPASCHRDGLVHNECHDCNSWACWTDNDPSHI